jgi:aminoglycoside phosphotransferase (APT) family kinase protein
MDYKDLVNGSCTPIAEGRTAEVFLLDEGHILKLYRAWCPPDWVEYEARIARAVHEAGIASPAAGEIIEVKGRYGLIYERIEGISMLQDMNARPWMILNHARSLAELHVRINQQSIPGLPSYKARLRFDIRNTPHLDEALRNKTLSILENLPAGQNVCHGDYHPGNVLITKRGPVVIDWMTASAGSPWADVARTCLLLTIGPKGEGNKVGRLTNLAVGFFQRRYLKSYKTLTPGGRNEMSQWSPVIAAARLTENIIPERAALLELVKRGSW